MSSLHRFLSASAASWSRILLTVLTQVLLVPVFLSHWSVEEYGCWLIIQTLVAISALLSGSHQNFVGFEFLKIGDKRRAEMRLLFYSALPYVLLIAAVELLGLLLLIFFGFFGRVFDPNHSMDRVVLHQAYWSVIVFSIYWVLTCISALASRAVAPYGHFARMAWWATFIAVLQALTSGVAVSLGANLLETTIWMVVAGAAANIPVHIDMWRMFRRYGLVPVAPDWKLGLKNVWYSLAIALSALLDISRQQGVRILLGGILGVTQMTAFSTTRTLSNLSLQGIGTITNPIMPEFMRFLRERDADRSNATVGFVWFLTVVLVAPVLIVFQWLMPTIFHIWTRGKMPFNPVLFGLFSISLLVFSVARPSVAVLQGNNLLKVQLWISIIVSTIAVGGIALLTAAFGVSGAASALLLAELVGTVLSISFASKWLTENRIGFPWRLFAVTLISIGIATVAIFSMIYAPRAVPLILVVSVGFSCLVAMAFIRQLPAVALLRVRALVSRLSLSGPRTGAT
jgi:O-antigen/teichoic acid export membrane protein